MEMMPSHTSQQRERGVGKCWNLWRSTCTALLAVVLSNRVSLESISDRVREHALRSIWWSIPLIQFSFPLAADASPPLLPFLPFRPFDCNFDFEKKRTIASSDSIKSDGWRMEIWIASGWLKDDSRRVDEMKRNVLVALADAMKKKLWLLFRASGESLGNFVIGVWIIQTFQARRKAEMEKIDFYPKMLRDDDESS